MCVSETEAGRSDFRSDSGPLSTAFLDSCKGASREQGEACGIGVSESSPKGERGHPPSGRAEEIVYEWHAPQRF